MPDIRQAHCPTCDGDRACDVHGQLHKPWTWESPDGEHFANGANDHRLLQCRGCETVFYEKESWDSEHTDHIHNAFTDDHEEVAIREKSTFPRPNSKTKPEWISNIFYSDAQLHKILEEMYVAIDNESYILAAIGLRTALDRATEVLGILPSLSFVKKLDALQSGGWIGDTEREVLGVVTDAGSAAAHRAWSPDLEEVRLLTSAFEVFLQRAFLVGKKALEMKGRIPKK